MKCARCRSEAVEGRSRCESCLEKARENARRRFVANPEKVREERRRWSQAHPEYERSRARENARRQRREKPDAWRKAQRRWHLLREYGLTLDDYCALLDAQGGHCATCAATEPKRGGVHLHVDHDHVAGFDAMPPEEKRRHVRGLLCARCNMALGRFGDDPSVLVALGLYITRGHRPLAAESPEPAVSLAVAR